MDEKELTARVSGLIATGAEGFVGDLKWDIDVSRNNKAGQAEFIRDVISLANADPANPSTRLLVLNAKRGEVNSEARSMNIDDATLQQIVNERVAPPIRFEKRVVNTDFGEAVVLVIQNTYEFPYMVDKEICDASGALLQRGQSWTRDGSGKRLLTRRDYDEIDRAKAERETRPGGVPTVRALVQASPEEVGDLAEKMLEAGKDSTLIRAVKRVANETAQAWRSTANNNAEDYLEEMADKVVSGCDWLTVVDRTAIEFDDQAALAECMSGLKVIYQLSAEEGLGHAGVALVRLSAWHPMLTAFPRMYIVGAFAIIAGSMKSAETVCTQKALCPSPANPQPKLLVNDPLFDLLSGPLRDCEARFDLAIELAESNALYVSAFAGSGGATSALCQFDLMASVFTPRAEWEVESSPTHYPNFMRHGFDMVRPLFEKAVDTPKLFAMVGDEPVHAILSNLKIVEEKMGSPTRRQLGPWPNTYLFQQWYERIEPYLRVERERREKH